MPIGGPRVRTESRLQRPHPVQRSAEDPNIVNDPDPESKIRGAALTQEDE
jgi:hypothetical protein